MHLLCCLPYLGGRKQLNGLDGNLFKLSLLFRFICNFDSFSLSLCFRMCHFGASLTSLILGVSTDFKLASFEYSLCTP